MIRLVKAATGMVAPLGIPLAWRQLVEDRRRMGVAILGITFGIMLMLFQLGLYNGIMAMVVLPHSILRGELVMVSPNYEYFGSSLEFSRRRLLQARSLPDVESTAPLYLGFLQWANPVNGRIKMIFAMAIDPDENPFIAPELLVMWIRSVIPKASSSTHCPRRNMVRFRRCSEDEALWKPKPSGNASG